MFGQSIYFIASSPLNLERFEYPGESDAIRSADDVTRSPEVVQAYPVRVGCDTVVPLALQSAADIQDP